MQYSNFARLAAGHFALWDELTPLVALKEEPEIIDHLQQLFNDLLPAE